MRSEMSILTSVIVWSACATTPTGGSKEGPLVPEPPERSVFIRASFDDDPSDFLGRFLPDELGPDQIDESAGIVSSRCRKYLSTKTINASGTFEQTFNASSAVKASIGVKPFGNFSGGVSGDAGLLVKYEMTKKMVVTVNDADAFAQCCEAARKECSTRMIGEFWYGTGTVSQFAGREADVGAKGTYQKVDGEISYKDGWAWKRVSTFNHAYFAFRTAAGPQPNRMCSEAWDEEVPESLDGKYFIGTAAVLAAEPKAREEAMRNARREVVKYLGEKLSERYVSESSTIGGVLEDETLVTSAADGVAERVKDKCWTKPKVKATPEGPYTEMKVLAFFPNAELAPAQVEAVAAMEKAAVAQKKPAVATKLKKLSAKLAE